MTKAIHQASQERQAKIKSKQEEMFRNLTTDLLQTKRTMWELVSRLGGEVAIEEEKINPLWQLEFTRDESGKLVIKSGSLPAPTEGEIKDMANGLIGTNNDPIEIIRASESFSKLPLPYVLGRLRPHIFYDMEQRRWTLPPPAETQSAPTCQPTTA